MSSVRSTPLCRGTCLQRQLEPNVQPVVRQKQHSSPFTGPLFFALQQNTISKVKATQPIHSNVNPTLENSQQSTHLVAPLDLPLAGFSGQRRSRQHPPRLYPWGNYNNIQVQTESLPGSHSGNILSQDIEIQCVCCYSEYEKAKVSIQHVLYSTLALLPDFDAQVIALRQVSQLLQRPRDNHQGGSPR